MALPGLIWTVHAIGIELPKANSLHPDVPYVTSTVAPRIQINHPGGRAILGMIKQLQPNAAGVPAEERKVHSFATDIDSQGQRHTHPNLSALANLCHIIMQRT